MQQIEQPAGGRKALELEVCDRAIQALYGVGLQLENCIYLVGESPAEARWQLESAIVRLNGLIRELRARIVELS